MLTLLACLLAAPTASARIAIVDPILDQLPQLPEPLQSTIDETRNTVDQLPLLPDPVQDPVDDVEETVEGVTPDLPGGNDAPALPGVPGTSNPGSGDRGNGAGPSRATPSGAGGGEQGGGGSPAQGDGGGGGRGADADGGRGGGDGRGGDGGRGSDERGTAGGDGSRSPDGVDGESGGSGGGSGGGDEDDGILTRTVREIEQVVPGPVKGLIGILILLALGLGARAMTSGARAKRLARHRDELRRDVGLLQQALLPEVPDKVGALAASVAYRPADGPAAGGDFYDVFELPGDRVAIIVGDVSGHGHAALSRSASMRWMLRAYVEAGLGPRAALSVAARTLGESDAYSGDFTTVVVAVYDLKTAMLTYSMAGHPPPVLMGSAKHEPVIACASPPVGTGLPTGQRQTSVVLAQGSLACFFTDGLIEARDRQGLLGQDRLAELVEEMRSDLTARSLLDRVLVEADQAGDDMAAVVVRATQGGAEPVRVEELEVQPTEVAAPAVERFLTVSGVSAEESLQAIEAARSMAVKSGAAVLRVTIAGGSSRVDVRVPGSPRVEGKLPEPADLLAAT